MNLNNLKAWFTGGAADDNAEPLDATDRLIAAIESRVDGSSPEQWISILEAACRLYRDCLAVCTVEGMPQGFNLGGAFLADIATDLCRKGESLYLMEVSPLRLLRVASWNIYGGAREGSWIYDCYLSGPSGQTETIRQHSAGVVHIRQATAPATPWRGLPPWGSAAGLAALLDISLKYEASGVVGTLMTQPALTGQAPQIREIKEEYLKALKTLRGRSFIIERLGYPFNWTHS